MSKDSSPFSDDKLAKMVWLKSQAGWAIINPDGSYKAVSMSFCKMVEYSQAELHGNKFQQITHPDDVEADVAMAKLLKLGEIPYYSMVKTFVKKSGYPVLVDLVVWPVLDDDGKFEYFLSQMTPKLDICSLQATKAEVKIDMVTLAMKMVSENKAMLAKVATSLIALITAIAFAITEVAKRI